MTEGERYVVSGVKLEGNYLGKEDEFKSLVTIRPGQPYNADQVAETTKAFTDYFGKFGYAFANVEARPEIDRANNRVEFVLAAEPSRRAYVRRVNISGNNRTRDEVIRREFRQFESSWYDADKIKLSRDRIDRLGYFKEVNVETSEVPGAPDQVDLNLTVVEKPTGSLQLGAGLSPAPKSWRCRSRSSRKTPSAPAITSAWKSTPASTTGRSSSIRSTRTSRPTAFRAPSTSTTARRSRTRTRAAITSWSRPAPGLRFGIPFSELDTVYFGGSLERTQIKPGTNIPAAYLAYAQRFGYTSTAMPLTVGWSRDSRDSAIAPTSGRYQRAAGEAGPDRRRALRARQLPVPAIRSAEQAVHAGASTASSAGARA